MQPSITWCAWGAMCHGVTTVACCVVWVVGSESRPGHRHRAGDCGCIATCEHAEFGHWRCVSCLVVLAHHVCCPATSAWCAWVVTHTTAAWCHVVVVGLHSLVKPMGVMLLCGDVAHSVGVCVGVSVACVCWVGHASGTGITGPLVFRHTWPRLKELYVFGACGGKTINVHGVPCTMFELL